MHLKITAFRAVNQPQICARFIEQHRNVLRDYGITNITTNNEDWVNNPDVYCIVAVQENDNAIVGGVRVQIATQHSRLPVELAIGQMDAGIFELVKGLREKGGVAEICALWNAKTIAGMGISIVLVRAAIAITPQLKINSLLTICADYTLKTFQKVGFSIYDTLGSSGEFPYPNASYTARVLRMSDPGELAGAEMDDRERIFSLRREPHRRTAEQGAAGQIIIDYNLVIPK